MAVFVFRVGIGEVDAGSSGLGAGYFVAVTNAAWREDVEGLDGGASEGGLGARFVIAVPVGGSPFWLAGSSTSTSPIPRVTGRAYWAAAALA